MKKVTLIAVFFWLLGISFATQANWYTGGNLHAENALAWQQASYENKLATSADFISTMYQNDHLTASISRQINGIDSLRPLAEELVSQLDDAFQPDPNPEENRRLFTKMKVGESAAMIMIMMGWLET